VQEHKRYYLITKFGTEVSGFRDFKENAKSKKDSDSLHKGPTDGVLGNPDFRILELFARFVCVFARSRVHSLCQH
jgi:hypothetical protein